LLDSTPWYVEYNYTPWASLTWNIFWQSQRIAASASDGLEVNDFTMRIVDDFDDAKRRVNVRRTPVGMAVAPEDHIAYVVMLYTVLFDDQV
jgi:hypothetical protein